MLLTSADQFVFLDESFCNTAMAREHGWAPIGDRVFGKRPGGTWKTFTLIGAIRLGARPKLMTHRGPVTAKVFLKFVRERLVPWLRAGDIVFMDNLRAHKTAAVRAAIERVGAVVIYLAPYSPDMNPIELWWADVKRDSGSSVCAVPTSSRVRCAIFAPRLPSTRSTAGSAMYYRSLSSTDHRGSIVVTGCPR